MIPCYVSGKGMHATERTRSFKVAVIQALQASGLAYDTRYRFYQRQFPDMDPQQLLQAICDPVEYYDKDWKPYLFARGGGREEDEVLAEFIAERDALFRREAQVAIYCYDEAGFGSGINSIRFAQEGKRILGFYNPEVKKLGPNLTNILQLRVEFPDLVTLVKYQYLEEIPERVVAWLREIRRG